MKPAEHMQPCPARLRMLTPGLGSAPSVHKHALLWVMVPLWYEAIPESAYLPRCALQLRAAQWPPHSVPCLTGVVFG